MGNPAVERWMIEIKASESFNINARRSNGCRVGKLIPLEKVTRKVSVSARWRIVSTG